MFQPHIRLSILQRQREVGTVERGFVNAQRVRRRFRARLRVAQPRIQQAVQLVLIFSRFFQQTLCDRLDKP